MDKLLEQAIGEVPSLVVLVVLVMIFLKSQGRIVNGFHNLLDKNTNLLVEIKSLLQDQKDHCRRCLREEKNN